jgi:hypothetical protein
VLEFSKGNIAVCETEFIVKDGETVEELLRRIGLDGTISWHYSAAEVKIKIVQS